MTLRSRKKNLLCWFATNYNISSICTSTRNPANRTYIYCNFSGGNNPSCYATFKASSGNKNQDDAREP